MLDAESVPVLITQKEIDAAKNVRDNFAGFAPNTTALALTIERESQEFEIRVVRDEVKEGALADCCWAEVVQFEDGAEIAVSDLDAQSVLDLVLREIPFTQVFGDRSFHFKPARLPSAGF